ncbi:hypothetical protein GCM10023318_51380 [Nocardia callitridis]|uniref:DNA polymerase III beta sliding clamp central domain-containing protein n=1 Tax=Nocardia callitridis TaxID=648753 RepID=A0ABP9KV79_9NOCA
MPGVHHTLRSGCHGTARRRQISVDTLPMLTGIRVEIAGQKVVLAATDRFRLAVRHIEWQPAQADIETSVLIRPNRRETPANRRSAPLVRTAIESLIETCSNSEMGDGNPTPGYSRRRSSNRRPNSRSPSATPRLRTTRPWEFVTPGAHTMEPR